MASPYFTFSSIAENRFPLTNGGLTARISRATKQLEIVLQDGTIRSFPLEEDGAKVKQALFISFAGDFHLEVGTADFLENSLLPMEFSLNEDERIIAFSINQNGGGLGVMDLRDAALRSGPRYKFNIVPIVLTIDGNYLRVTTLEPDTETNLDPWFIENYSQP